jgi:threonine/homoserine/homoserine lactone efflux protein
MVDLHTLGLFALASLALIVVPGPSVGFILATTLRRGRSAGLRATAGIELGYLVHVAAAVVGVSAVIAASATAFTVVKVAGAAWLLWLAIRAWRARTPGTVDRWGHDGHGARPGHAPAANPAGPAGSGSPEPDAVPRRGEFRAGLLVGALNPKTALFYLAFLPQFVRPEAGPPWSQLLILGLVFIGLAWTVDSLWAIGGDGLRRLLPRVRLAVLDRVSAGVYAVLGLVTLAARRVT